MKAGSGHDGRVRERLDRFGGSASDNQGSSAPKAVHSAGTSKAHKAD